ncbi:MAG: energy-dependent translational throttle protein EttA [Gammaproteobacteria bacterium]|nr:energy-dependent translational throttle protein EttA [Gammaproteobacteria bacterium]
MAQYVFSMSGVGKVVPPKTEILKDISLNFFPGAKIGVLGYNGAGKSTLLRIMAGVDKEYIGEARPQANLNIGYLQQEPELDKSLDVRGNVELGISPLKQALDAFNEVSMKFAEPMSDDEMTALLEKQAELQDQIEAADGWNLDRKLEVAADALRLPPWEATIDKLSGGERRRVALCQLLLSNPDMLILDEPTNHLDADSVSWLEQFLKEYQGTVIAVTHDRYFLDNVAGWILELDRGHGIPWEGNYSSWLDQKETRLKQEEKQQQARMKTISAELEWVRSNPKARQAKSKARLKRFEELNSQDYQKRAETNEIFIPVGDRLGDQIIEANGITKRFDDRVLFDNVSFNIPRGAIVGVIGGNGVGKTTLFKMIVGQEKADDGNLKVGESVKLSYVDQLRDDLQGDNTVWQEISDGLDNITVGNYSMPSRSYVGRFNFKGSGQQKLVKELSGGERNRLQLAKLLRKGGNVLLLDEPTNDLDVETLRALEEGLLNFPGSAIVISHDRWFLDRIATHILAFEDEGNVYWFEGNFSEYEEDRKKRLGEEASQPKRVKYKRLDA